MSLPKWFIVYRSSGSLKNCREYLDQTGLEYFVPTTVKEELSKDGREMVGVEVPVISNLVFIHTDRNILEVVNSIDFFRAPYKDHTTGRPAVVDDNEMNRFMAVVNARKEGVLILRDPFSKFAPMQKVRVRAGEFEGFEGRVVRILRDRKFVISLGTMAVAISGIHHTLLEPID